MPRRIIGQCNTADFKDLEHLSTLMHRGEYLHLNLEMTARQRAAVTVLRHLQSCGVPFSVALKIREVLIWELPDKGLAFEYKLIDRSDIKTREILRAMVPKKMEVT